MKIKEILDLILKLSASQGFYGRLYKEIMEAKQYSPDVYDEIVSVLEDQNFQSPVDVVMFLEG